MRYYQAPIALLATLVCTDAQSAVTASATAKVTIPNT